MPGKKGFNLINEADAKRLARALRDEGPFCAWNPPWPAAAAIAMETAAMTDGAVMVVTDGPLSLERTLSDIAALSACAPGGRTVAAFPGRESFPGHGAPPSPQLTGERLRTLMAMASERPAPLVVTSIQALMQRTPGPAWIAGRTRVIRPGDDADPVQLASLLEEIGYAIETEVLSPGQASWRGSILDIWPPGAEWPLRLEFFDTEVESIRTFDPAEQRSLSRCSEITLLPAAESEAGGLLIDHVRASPAVIWIDRESIDEHADLFARAAAEAGAEDAIIDRRGLAERIQGTHPALDLSFDQRPPLEGDPWACGFEPLAGVPSAHGAALALDRVEEQRKRFLDQLVEKTRQGWTLHVFFGTEGTMQRFEETRAGLGADGKRIRLHQGVLSESCVCEGTRQIWLNDTDLYGIRREQQTGHERKRRRQLKRRVTGERVQSWTDIQPGDYVVHIDHGIGIYRGLFEINVHGGRQEVLTVEYADQARVYIPTSQTHLLSRYIGVGKRHPRLHTIGGKRWTTERAAAERAVEDLAAQLLETQAARDARPGHAFSPDTVWQHEFEAAFPFSETPDQAQAIQDVKQDMENSRPMDRLICGDVGYGKTEVAMRASFKAVMDGKQVAILVPTTVLAQQHYDSFTARMSAFPVRIEVLSRFQNRTEQQDIIERLARGAVDIVIGTHRLVQRDVRFRDLGLVIIDEEQRFGVKHKEHLKRLRHLVDVLTMTATPIPRTLYMSLTGAKDLSIIETAPVERLPIETIITENRPDIVREAVLRELNREGQIYYLYNRVQTIEHVRDQLVRLVPEARIRVAHGQMKEGELSSIMRGFTRGDFDLLLCTTIIESGLNIPNVNTIIIDRADRFGLAELYQLRGRVGRYKRKAYAYLLLPKHGQLFFMARQRIGAVKRYSSLGSGFKLAMRDLELRGAGNILGAEQSGHIATVGFDLYCQLLQRTVNRLKGETPPRVIEVDLALDFIALAPDHAGETDTASIPVSYIEDETLRVRLYRRMAAISGEEELAAFRGELADRFGPVPEPVERALTLIAIKLAADRAGISRIEVSGEKVIMTRNGDYIMTDKRFPRLQPAPATERLRALLVLVEQADTKKGRPGVTPDRPQ